MTMTPRATCEALERDAHEPTAEAFRVGLRTLATGVTVVTSAGEQPCGVTANAFTAVSLSPPLVLVCLRATSSSAETIAGNGVFAVNVLSADQELLAQRYASPARPRGEASFRGVAHRVESTGSPILEGVACWLDCRLTDLHPGGDHVIAVGEVLALDSDPSHEPLVFHAGRYRAVCNTDGRAPSPIPFPVRRTPERR
jgi:flavin reductase (DIM6/NTAB) family NADH-FMN oxidoreductase RutF